MGSDLLEIGIKMFLAYRKIKAGQEQLRSEQEGEVYQSVTDEGTALMQLRDKEGAVILDIGGRGSGKTELAYKLAQFIGKPTYAVSPEQKPHPTFIQQIGLENVSEMVPPRSTVILDDAPVQLSNRDYHDVLVQEVERMVPMVRHERKLHLIVVTQSGSFIDRWLLDCDAAFLKPQSLFASDFERPAIKRAYQYATPHFEGQSEEWIRRHAYFICPTYRGIVTINKVES